MGRCRNVFCVASTHKGMAVARVSSALRKTRRFSCFSAPYVLRKAPTQFIGFGLTATPYSYAGHSTTPLNSHGARGLCSLSVPAWLALNSNFVTLVLAKCSAHRFGSHSSSTKFALRKLVLIKCRRLDTTCLMNRWARQAVRVMRRLFLILSYAKKMKILQFFLAMSPFRSSTCYKKQERNTMSRPCRIIFECFFVS